MLPSNFMCFIILIDFIRSSFILLCNEIMIDNASMKRYLDFNEFLVLLILSNDSEGYVYKYGLMPTTQDESIISVAGMVAYFKHNILNKLNLLLCEHTSMNKLKIKDLLFKKPHSKKSFQEQDETNKNKPKFYINAFLISLRSLNSLLDTHDPQKFADLIPHGARSFYCVNKANEIKLDEAIIDHGKNVYMLRSFSTIEVFTKLHYYIKIKKIRAKKILLDFRFFDYIIETIYGRFLQPLQCYSTDQNEFTKVCWEIIAKIFMTWTQENESPHSQIYQKIGELCRLFKKRDEFLFFIAIYEPAIIFARSFTFFNHILGYNIENSVVLSEIIKTYHNIAINHIVSILIWTSEGHIYYKHLNEFQNPAKNHNTKRIYIYKAF